MIDGCKFKCKYCTHEETSWRRMTSHIYTTHKIKTVHNPLKLVVDCKIFECTKCKIPILQDRQIIYQHMFVAHKIRLSRKHIQSKKQQRVNQRVAKNPDFVINGCQFRCKFCQEIFESWQSAQKHHWKNH